MCEASSIRYEQPSFDSRDKTEFLLTTGPPATVCSAIIGAGLFSPDGRWVELSALDLTSHADADVRRAAITTIGHLARRFRTLSEPDAVENAIVRLQRDPELVGAVEDLIDDLQTFAVLPEIGPKHP